MKKFLALMMSLMMVLSLAACGGSDVEDTADDAQVESEADVTVEDEVDVDTEVEVEVEVETEVETQVEAESDVYYLAVGDFTELPAYEMPDLSGTTWSWAGATVDGIELNQDEFLAMLEAYSGKNDIVFGTDGASVQMVQGGGVAEGTCEYVEDGTGLYATFDMNGTEKQYACLLTEVEGVSVLMVMSDEASAFYYLLQ